MAGPGPKAATNQARVLWALMMREMATRYGRSGLGYVWAVIEPAGFIALLTLLFTQIAHTPPVGKSFPLFYATGFMAFHWVIDIASVTGRSVHVNRPLLAFPAITPLDTVLARFLLQALTGVAVAAVVFSAILVAFPDQVRLSPGPIMAAFGLAALLGLGIGAFNAFAFAVSKSWELAWGVLSRPLFLVSAVFFSFASLPAFAQDALWWNPIVHLVGLVRAGFYPVYDPAYVSPAYVLAVALALLGAGLWGMRRADMRLAEP